MAARKVVLTDDVENELREIYLYHAEVEEPDRGLKIIDSLYDTFDKLALKPELGRAYHSALEPEKQVQIYLHFQRYWVVYTVTDNTIFILRVIHGSKDHNLFDALPLA